MKTLFNTFLYAWQGILAALRSERNLKVHFVIAVLTVAGGFYFSITPTEWCLVILCIGMVIAAEMLNTAIEDVINLITIERKPLAGKVKDVAAGAVLVVSVTALIIGIIIFRKYLI